MAEAATTGGGGEYRIRTLRGDLDGLPLVIEPQGDPDPEHLAAWLRDNSDRLGK